MIRRPHPRSRRWRAVPSPWTDRGGVTPWPLRRLLAGAALAWLRRGIRLAVLGVLLDLAVEVSKSVPSGMVQSPTIQWKPVLSRQNSLANLLLSLNESSTITLRSRRNTYIYLTNPAKYKKGRTNHEKAFTTESSRLCSRRQP